MKKTLFVIVLFLAAAVFLPAAQFTDDFERADGPLTEWFQYAPDAQIQAGMLTLASTSGLSPWAWAGIAGEPVFFQEAESITFTIEFTDGNFDPADVVRRHGGIFFCASSPTQRYDSSISGYFLDWIDREDPAYNDHGFRLHRVDAGVPHVPLAVGTSLLTDPPTEWRIEFTETGFKIYGDGELVTFDEQFDSDPLDDEINDTTYRNGYIGFWCYSNVGQSVSFDDVDIELSSGGCPRIAADSVRARFEDPDRSIAVDIPFGANDTEAYTVTVSSTDPDIAVPVGATGGALDLVFGVGDSPSKSFDLHFGQTGTAELQLSVPGIVCDKKVEVNVVPKPHTVFSEDFTDEMDGPPEDFVVYAPDVTIESEELALRSTAGVEPHAWAGKEGIPILCNDIAKIDFSIRFGDFADPAIGRHGGVAFCCQAPTRRWNNPNYTIDYLERDQNFRIGKGFANGTQEWLATIPGISDPGSEWTIELTSTTITFSVDGAEVAVVEDSEHRSGYVGFWSYSNPGQELFIDDVEITFAPDRCGTVIAPQNITLHPGDPAPEFNVQIPFGVNLTDDYTMTLTSSAPQVAKPVGSDAVGTLTLTFEKGGELSQAVPMEITGGKGFVQLDVNDSDAECVFDPARPGASAILFVPEVAEEFSDDFQQPDGPAENWTVFGRDWAVTDGALANTGFTGVRPEPLIVAGNPPIMFENTETISFDFEFGELLPPDAIGHHGGVQFFTSDPVERWTTDGYEVDWIDRLADHGYRLIRFDAGVQTALAGPTLDMFPDPGLQWKIQVDGDEISFYSDGELVFSVFDATYREGFVSVFAYTNGTELKVDNVVISAGSGETSPKFVRGDVNVDGSFNLADVISALSFLFGGGSITCADSADINDDGSLNIADPITLLQYLFSGGDDPPAPFDACGKDGVEETPDLGCESYDRCN